MEKLTPNERRLIWDAMLDADLATRYYTVLANRYERQNRWLALLAFVLASGVVGTIVLEAGGYYPSVAALLSMLASGVALTFRLDQRAADAAALYRQFTGILAHYESLWSRIDETDALQVRSTFDRLRAETGAMSESAAREFGDNGKLSRKSYQQVLESRGLALPG